MDDATAGSQDGSTVGHGSGHEVWGMEFEQYTDRAKGCLQSAQTMALRRGHQRLTPGYPSIVT